MNIKRVNRYYCEYCKKSGGASGHMRIHELHCTMNPRRVCRMCKTGYQDQVNIESVLPLLPKVSDFTREDHGEIIIDGSICDLALDIIRTYTTCPACTLSLFRLAGISCGSFDFTDECKKWWDRVNDTMSCNE